MANAIAPIVNLLVNNIHPRVLDDFKTLDLPLNFAARISGNSVPGQERAASMPYTPPSQQSPVASKSSSPTISRTHSYTKSLPQNVTSPTYGPRPGLPRSHSSTSYLTMHRRSPSSPSVTSPSKPNQLVETPEHTPSRATFKDPRLAVSGSNSVRQSPPPLNDLSMPTGAVISPPDSAQNSSDDEDAEKRGRTRKLENLAELQAAIRVIEQKREGSPDKIKRETDQVRIALGLLVPSDDSSTERSHSPAAEGRRISHGRSNTESAVIDLNRFKTESPNRSSDSDIEDEERIQKPPMLRKKSGELVRPALRPAYAKRRPSSMPGTPTYSKAVHFDQHLEHVKHFLQVDRPLAVSANSSPVDNYESELEFPFGTAGRPREMPWKWEIKLPNFPHPSISRREQPVHVEKMFLSSDCKTLIGNVAVQNLAFHKMVVARFTLDHWKTTSEVTAEYSHDTNKPNDGLDRFNFNIKLEDLANLENRTLFFCVRYVVNGQEHWDSNGLTNFQVNFVKKALPQNGKQGTIGAASRPLNALPRSRPSPPTSSNKPRPKSASSFDDFARGLESDFQSSLQPSLNETPIRFRNKPAAATGDEGPSSPTLRKKAPTQAFGNRYDFGASLSAAIQAAATTLGDRSGFPQPPPKQAESKAVPEKPTSDIKQSNGGIQKIAPVTVEKPVALTSAKPDVKSSSYTELLDKYCFFGSKNSAQPSKPGNGQLDGFDDTDSTSGSLTDSPAPSPQLEENRTIAPATSSPHLSRSSSPAVHYGSRTQSPVFGYPYHQAMQHGMFSDSHTPTAIRG